MRIFLILFLAAFLGGCPVTFKGNLKNSSNDTIYHLTAWTPFEKPIKPGEKERIKFHPEGCLELIVHNKPRYFVPPEAPKDVFHPKIFSVHVELLYSSEGLYYPSKDGLIEFSEVESCGT